MLPTIEHFLTTAAICGGVTAGICLLIRLLRRDGRHNLLRTLAVTAFAWYLCFMLVVELAPLAVINAPESLWQFGSEMWQHHPMPWFNREAWCYSFRLPYKWSSLWDYRHEMELFLPLGVLVPLLWNKFDIKVIPLGLYIVLGLETWQLLIGRSFDASDILLETAAVAAGYLLYVLLDTLLPAVTSRMAGKTRSGKK